MRNRWGQNCLFFSVGTTGCCCCCVFVVVVVFWGVRLCGLFREWLDGVSTHFAEFTDVGVQTRFQIGETGVCSPGAWPPRACFSPGTFTGWY